MAVGHILLGMVLNRAGISEWFGTENERQKGWTSNGGLVRRLVHYSLRVSK